MPNVSHLLPQQVNDPTGIMDTPDTDANTFDPVNNRTGESREGQSYPTPAQLEALEKAQMNQQPVATRKRTIAAPVQPRMQRRYMQNLDNPDLHADIGWLIAGFVVLVFALLAIAGASAVWVNDIAMAEFMLKAMAAWGVIVFMLGVLNKVVYDFRSGGR